MLNQIREWLKTFPGMPEILVDYQGVNAKKLLNGAPGARLYPKGVTLMSRRGDITGAASEALRADFALEITFPADDAESNAQWLIAFQDWVRGQYTLGLTPQLGNRGATVFMATGGRAAGAVVAPAMGGQAAAQYTVKLYALYENQL